MKVAEKSTTIFVVSFMAIPPVNGWFASALCIKYIQWPKE